MCAKRSGIYAFVFVLLFAGIISLDAATVGWRTDGTGRYPDVDPATQWSAEKGVVWKTALPKWSNATPVIAGDKLFVCAEDSTLVCIDKNTGKVLWEKSISILDLAKDEQEKAKIQESLAKVELFQKELDSVNQQMRDLKGKLKNNPQDKESKEQMKTLKTESEAIKEKMKPYEEYANPPAHNANGYTSATPVSDGKNVYAVFGTGIAAGFDMAGNVVWSKKLDRPPHKWGSCMSPILVDGVLVVQIDKMYGLDPDTGKEEWSVKCGWGWGSPVVHPIGKDNYIFTCKGDVVNAKTGEVVASGLHNLGYGGPIADDGIVYYIQDKALAYKLPESLPEKLELKPVWECTLKKDRYYGSPLLHDGLIYAITRNGIMSVIDAKTGEKVYEEKVPFAEGATVYPSITLGGKYIFISNEKGHTVVIKPGRKFETVAMNSIDGFRSCPVFEGSRMYIRTLSSLYCIGK